MENRPPPPQKPSAEPPRGSWLGIMLALGAASFIGAALSFVTLFYLLPVFVVGGVIFFVAAFHYFVWGWWMREFINQAEKEED